MAKTPDTAFKALDRNAECFDGVSSSLDRHLRHHGRQLLFKQFAELH